MIYIHYVLWLIQLYFGFFLILPLLIWLLHLLVKRPSVVSVASTPPDYGIIVTAYQYTDQLEAVVDSILQSEYNHYMVYVVADNCDISKLHFSDPRVVLLRPERILAGNVRSHFYAIQHFVRPHTHLTIIDSDNLVESDYLSQLNSFFEAGFKAVQGVRQAKNLDTSLSRLDAARDIYYHYYDGKLLFKIGSSATLAGSGMAFTTSLYRQCLEGREVDGAGFDKVLQHAIVSRGERIAFADEAVVWDQKTAESQQLVNQRARWINTWFKYFTLGFGLMKQGVVKTDWNRFMFGVVLLRPPLFIFLLLSLIFAFVNIWLFPTLTLIWVLGILLFTLGFMMALWAGPTSPAIYRALKGIPTFVFYQIVSLLKASRANQISVSTKHKSSSKKDTP
ncbi:cellulose synthase/poly-beta-1,6-N-acetylglucosamine synthase-like glycosyltransferase [Dyadobacter jejuensis]|uniref:Cellulose synthase/poly-beta-1,6-N-acetylglucosamine synthase-like glycosyltransferase n=1 Tax=Dyadobacter jejuensis TaxID=1082580 RepID=A0A316AMH5_9BACT|nr:glycosyltransferase [Dyadobacter jejuensis]PWJ58776.1 cellulose synthase/poly-beta-1,6-N-acetylglucosamine synthase-like glycosyltransferase [Dyadobacter jejuensis]